MKSGAPDEGKLRELMMKMPDVKSAPAEQVKALVDGQLRAMRSPWFRRFLALDPRESLRKLTRPVLALNGERDMQVSAKQNLPEIDAALKAAHNADYTIKTLPKLNHLFQTCATGAPTEYAQIEETMAPAALQAIGDWIVAHSK